MIHFNKKLYFCQTIQETTPKSLDKYDFITSNFETRIKLTMIHFSRDNHFRKNNRRFETTDFTKNSFPNGAFN